MSVVLHGSSSPCPICGSTDKKCKSEPSTAVRGGTFVLCRRGNEAEVPTGIKDLGEVDGGPGGRKFLIDPNADVRGFDLAKLWRSREKSKATGTSPFATLNEAQQHLLANWVFRWCQSFASSGVKEMLATLERKGAAFDTRLYAPLPATKGERERFEAEADTARPAGLSGVEVIKRIGNGTFIEAHLGLDGRAKSLRKNTVHGPRSVTGISPALHFPPGFIEALRKFSILIVTEGARKASVTQERAGYATLGLSSVSMTKEGAATIERLAREHGATVYLAPDMGDMKDGQHHGTKNHEGTRREALLWLQVAPAIEAVGAEVKGLNWPNSDRAKGIDDALIALEHRGCGLPAGFEVLDPQAWSERFVWRLVSNKRKAQRALDTAISKRETRRQRVRNLVENPASYTLTEARSERLKEILGAALDSARAGKIAVIQTPTGTGKTHALAAIQDETTATFFRTYEHLEEFREKAAELGHADKDSFHVHYGTSHCELPNEVLDRFRLSPGERPQFPPTHKGSVCSTCELKPTCKVWTQGRKGQPILAAHASGESLSEARRYDSIFGDIGPMLDGRVAIFDEMPATLKTVRFSRKEVLDPVLKPGKYRLQNQEDQGASVAHQKLLTRLSNLAANVKASLNEASNADRRHPDVISLKPSDFSDEDREVLGAALMVQKSDFHSPNKEHIEAGAGPGDFPYLKLVDLWHQLGVASGAVLTSEVVRQHLVAEVNDWTVNFEIRTPLPVPIPKGGGAVILDATAAFSIDELRAANPDADIEVFQLDVTQDSGAPVYRVHIVTGSAGRGSTMTAGKPKPRWEATAANVVERALEAAIEAGLDPVAAKVGFIAPKALADELRSKSSVRKKVGAKVEKLIIDPKLVGHWGCHERGTNMFEECDIVVTFGDPWPNIGSVRADAEALDLGDPGGLAQNRMLASLDQAVGRIRPLESRDYPRLIVHAGKELPASWTGLDEVLELNLRATDEDRSDALEDALEALKSGIPLPQPGLVKAAWGDRRQLLYRPSIANGVYRHWTGSTRPNTVALKEAESFVDELLGLAAEDGFECVIDTVKVPGRAGRPPSVIRLASMPAIEVGAIMARLIAEAKAAAQDEVELREYVVPRPPVSAPTEPAPVAVEPVANEAPQVEANIANNRRSPSKWPIEEPEPWGWITEDDASELEGLEAAGGFAWDDWGGLEASDPVGAPESAAGLSLAVEATVPSVEELEASGALLEGEELRAELMDHVGLRRAFEADREREAFLVDHGLEDPFDVPLEDSAPSLEVHGATYIPAHRRALVGILVHAHAEHRGIRLGVREIADALPEFIFNDAPPRSGFGKLRDRVHRGQLWGLNPDSLAKDILADLLFDGALGDEPQAFLRADGFRVPVTRGLVMGDVKLGGWPMFPEHDDARILEFRRPDPSAPRWAEKHERGLAEGAAAFSWTA